MTRLAILAALLLCGIGCGRTDLVAVPVAGGKGEADADVDSDSDADADSDVDADTDDAFCSEFAGSQFFLDFDGSVRDVVTHGCGFLAIENADISDDEKYIKGSTLHFVTGDGEIVDSQDLDIHARRLFWQPLYIENTLLIISGMTETGEAALISWEESGSLNWAYTNADLDYYGAFAMVPGPQWVVVGNGQDEGRIDWIWSEDAIDSLTIPQLFEPEPDGYTEQGNPYFRNVVGIEEGSVIVCGLVVASGEQVLPAHISFVARVDGYDELAWSTTTLHEEARFFDCMVRESGEGQPVVLATGEITESGNDMALFELTADGEVVEAIGYGFDELDGRGYSLRGDGDGVIVGGCAWESSDTWADAQPMIARLGASHDLVWRRLFGFTGGVEVARPAEGGGYVTCGWKEAEDPDDDRDGFLIRADAEGYY